jgi:hypothetical protein
LFSPKTQHPPYGRVAVAFHTRVEDALRSLAMAQETKKEDSKKEATKKGSNQGGGSERKSGGGQRENNR